LREYKNICRRESGLFYLFLKKHRPWFDEGCSQLLNQRQQAKLQWLQEPNEIHGDNGDNVRREASGHFRNKKRECLKHKINDLGTKLRTGS
jgi:hypothetical protein